MICSLEKISVLLSDRHGLKFTTFYFVIFSSIPRKRPDILREYILYFVGEDNIFTSNFWSNILQLCLSRCLTCSKKDSNLFSLLHFSVLHSSLFHLAFLFPDTCISGSHSHPDSSSLPRRPERYKGWQHIKN